MVSQKCGGKEISQTGKCDRKDLLVEKAQNDWFSAAAVQDISISGPMLKLNEMIL